MPDLTLNVTPPDRVVVVSLGGSDVAWENVKGKPSTFTPSTHGHAIADVTGLQTELDDKASINHTHSGDGGTATPSTVTWNDVQDKPATFTPSTHNHAQAEVTGLSTALDGKSDTSHTHTGFAPITHSHQQSEVSGLDTALAAKANTSHAHTTSDVTGLDTEFAGKSDVGHTHAPDHTHTNKDAVDRVGRDAGTGAPMWDGGAWPGASGGGTVAWTDVTGKPETFTPATHNHTQSDVTGLDTTLAGKADATHNHDTLYAGKAHSHAISDTVDLQTSLDGKAPVDHTHTPDHTHDNKESLDLISKDASGNPQWNGVAWPGGTGGTGSTAWADITDKPTEFTPSAHAHKFADIDDSGLSVEINGTMGSYLPAGNDGTLYLKKAAQSIQVPSTGPITKVSLYVKKNVAGDTTSGMVVSIMNDSAGTPGTTVYASAKVSSQLVTTAYGWLEVAFASPFSPQLSTNYWVVLAQDSELPSGNGWRWGAVSPGAYATGVASQHSTMSGGSWSNYTTYDLIMRVYGGQGTLQSVLDGKADAEHSHGDVSAQLLQYDIKIAKTHFEFDSYIGAQKHQLSDMIIDTLNDDTGVNYEASSGLSFDSVKKEIGPARIAFSKDTQAEFSLGTLSANLTATADGFVDMSTPSGATTDLTTGCTASDSGHWTDNPASMAFDNSTVNHWLGNTPTNAWVAAKFSSAQIVDKVVLKNSYQPSPYDKRSAKSCRLEASNDGTTWTKVSAITAVSGGVVLVNGDEFTLPAADASYTAQVVLFANTTPYLYYRVFVIDNYGDAGFVGLAEIEMFQTGASELYTSEVINLGAVGTVVDSAIDWTATSPTGSSVAVDVNVSLDGTNWGGWITATNNGSVPGISAGVDLTNAKVQYRARMTTSDAVSAKPRLDKIALSFASSSSSAVVVWEADTLAAQPTSVWVTADQLGHAEFYLSRDNGVTFTSVALDTLVSISSQPAGQTLVLKADLTGTVLKAVAWGWK